MTETVGVTESDITEVVRNTSLLADLTVGVWSGCRTDKALMDKLKEDTGAVGTAGRVIKYLLSGCDARLKETQSAFNAVRQVHTALTLPWGVQGISGGPRLLPNVGFERYLEEMSRTKRHALNARDTFVHEYPGLVIAAKLNLAGMASDADYPSPAEVGAAFHVTFDFQPIPTGASFRGLPPHVIERLSNGLQARQRRMIEAAEADLWTQVAERVRHLLSKLTDDTRLFTSTVENCRELLVLMPGWNLTDDPRVREIRADIEAMLDGATIESIRKNRGPTIDAAERINNKLKGFGI